MRVGLVLHRCEQLRAFGVCRQHDVEQTLRPSGRFLGHRPDAPTARRRDLAVVSVQLPEDQLEQRRLARAIASDKANASPGGQCRACSFQDFAPRDPVGNVVEHKHGAPPIADRLAVQ